MTTVSTMNPNKALWEKGDSTRIADTMLGVECWVWL
jgi:hypothetical protein